MTKLLCHKGIGQFIVVRFIIVYIPCWLDGTSVTSAVCIRIPVAWGRGWGGNTVQEGYCLQSICGRFTEANHLVPVWALCWRYISRRASDPRRYQLVTSPPAASTKGAAPLSWLSPLVPPQHWPGPIYICLYSPCMGGSKGGWNPVRSGLSSDYTGQRRD